MGRFPLPTEKQRHQIIQHRKNYEVNLSNSLRMQAATQRGRSAPPKVSDASAKETSNIPQVIETEVIRSSPGVLVVQYKHESTHTKYTGILLAENGYAYARIRYPLVNCSENGTPGIISEDMSRFRETVNAYVDAPIIDQWTSVIGERFTTSGLQLRARSYMRKNGRMITRKHFVNVNQRKLQSIPKETKRIVAQLPPSEKPVCFYGACFGCTDCGAVIYPIVVDEVGYELLDEHLSGETADYSSDASVSSAPLRRRNKRKAYVPRGACSVLVPAGVDLFEPEYDPLPGPSSDSAKGLCNVEPSHKHAKNRLPSSVTTKNRRGNSALVKNSASSKTVGSLPNNNPEQAENKDIRNVSGGSMRRFKSDKIRRAFSTEYSIRKPVSDSLHMTFVRQSNEHDICPPTGHRSRPPSVDSSRQQSFAMPSVDRSLIQFTASPPVHPHQSTEIKKKGRDVREDARLASTKAETENNVERDDQCRPPIKIVLKPVKKCEMNPPLQKKCEMRHSSPVNTSDGAAQALARSIPDLRYPPAIEKAVFKIRSPIPQRRSDAGCPPMIKATSTEISTHLDRGSDRDEFVNIKNCAPWENILETGEEEGVQDRCVTKTRVAGNFLASAMENNGFSIGDIVWARNGMFPYWPGRIHEFVQENKKGGASIVWYGDNTYTPFIEFARIEKFTDSYETRFNPMRPDLKYHKAVANAIISCLPLRGYFENKLSSQVHEVLIKEKVDLGEVNIIAKCKKRTSSGSSHRRRKIVATRIETQETEGAEIVKTVIPSARANGDGSAEL
ncbi:unnamed protein product [Litomosoides sigmodontis]|uniref:PWWP domain-containing protein n=1 Tax=Litomosoides sigmodontis TaxID=42156 RepID=A0A3P6V3M5_LITSI|nr:unnamed protein product [Litomosoides sigmodontis]